MRDTASVGPDIPELKVVDIHAHAVPQELLAALGERKAPGELPVLRHDRRIQFGSRRTSPVSADLVDMAGRVLEMDRMGVDLQVLSPWMELSPDELAPAAACSFVRRVNDGMAEIVAQQPGRFRALALVNRRDPFEAAAELERSARLGGFVGVEVAAGGTGPQLHDEAWDSLWDAASQRGSLVLLHPWRSDVANGPAERGLEDIVHNPAQSTAVVGAMILRGVFERFPELRLCVVHGGGFLPYQAGRFDAIARLRPDWHDSRARPSSVLRGLYYDTLTHSPEALRWLVEFAGSDHVMLGSDCPFPTGDPDAVAGVRSAGIATPQEVASVLGGTACRLLGC